jgi:hypothetical protein
MVIRLVAARSTDAISKSKDDGMKEANEREAAWPANRGERAETLARLSPDG